jgi:citrate lyase subunit beta/citryl-CoA lyase
VTSEILEADLDALAVSLPDGVFLEGCAGRAHVQQLSVKLAVREAAAGLGAGATRIVALAAQTPAGVFDLGRYRGASSRLAALALDETPLPGGAQARQAARTLLLLGAAAAGIAALDFAPALDGEAFAAFCGDSRRDGFSGMLTLASGQIGGIEAAFRAL